MRLLTQINTAINLRQKDVGKKRNNKNKVITLFLDAFHDDTLKKYTTFQTEYGGVPICFTSIGEQRTRPLMIYNPYT